MKAWILLIGAVLLVGMLLGCTQPDTNPTKVTTESEAIKVTTDVSSDLSGINSALSDIDNTLTDKP